MGTGYLNRSTRLAAGLLGVVALGSCGDGIGPAPVTPLSTVLAQFTNVEGYFPVGLRRADAVEVGPSGVVPASCIFVAATSMFVCPEITTSGVSVARKYQLLNATAQSLPEFDINAVAAIRIITTASGVVTTPASFSMPATSTAFTSSANQTFSGLLGTSRVINGQATTVATFTKNGKTTNTTSALTLTSVVPPLTAADVLASDGFGFPMSGVVTTAVTGVDTLGAAFSAAVVTTFNGTPTVATKVTRSGTVVTWTCTYSKNTATGGTQIFVTCSSS